MADLYTNLGEMEYDGLVTDVKPEVIVAAGTIASLSAAGTLKRGTILAKNTSGKLIVCGSATGTAYGILCDDTEVGTSADVVAPIYVAGTFDPEKCIVADEYTLSATDIDALRNGGIYLKAAQN